MILVKEYSTKSGTTTTLTVNRPSGTIRVGDLLIAHIACDNHTVGRKTIQSIPSGWILAADSAGVTNNSHAVLYKVATSNEAASYTFTFAFSDEFSIHIVHVTTDSTLPVTLGITKNVLSSGTSAGISLTGTPFLYMAFFSFHGSALLGAPTGLTLSWTDKLVSYGPSSVGYKWLSNGGSSGTSSSSGADKSIAIAITTTNSGPTQPEEFISQPAANSVNLSYESVVVKWGASTDPEGDAIKYNLEFYNGSSWIAIASDLTVLTYTHVLPSLSIINAQYRVKAVDAKGGESEYRTSNVFTVRKQLVLVRDGESIKTYKNDSWESI